MRRQKFTMMVLGCLVFTLIISTGALAATLTDKASLLDESPSAT